MEWTRRWRDRDQGLAKALRQMEHWCRLGRGGGPPSPSCSPSGRRHGCALSSPLVAKASRQRRQSSVQSACSRTCFSSCRPAASASSALSSAAPTSASSGSDSRGSALVGGRRRFRLSGRPRLRPPGRLLRGPRGRRGGLLRALVLRAPAGLSRLLGHPVDGQLHLAARVLLGQVAPQLGGLREGAGAGGAAQRGLRAVAAQVAGEVRRPAEGLGAQRAGVGPEAGVAQPVP